MIQQDTIQLISDSIKTLSVTPPVRHHAILKVDTTMVTDTLKTVVQAVDKNFDIPYLYLPNTESGIDSTFMFESVKAVAKFQSGFEGKLLPSLPQTENWVFIAILLLFFLFVFSVSQSSGLILETVRTFFQVKERSSIFSKVTINDFRFRFFLISFSTGVISLYAYVLLHNSSSPFDLREYLYFIVVTSIFFGIKALFIDLICYVFFDPRITKMAKNSYFNIISFLGIALFPLLISYIYMPVYLSNITETISLVICIIGCILIIIKLFQIFLHKTIASFYILLYLCTLEFLPLLALFKVYQLIA